MFVQTEVRESTIFGKGLFSAEAVRKGTVVCCFTLGSRVTTEDRYVQAVSREEQPVTRTGTRYVGRYFTYGNEQEPYNFINHAFEPNLLVHCGVVVALRDLAPGEEFTMDYRYLIDTTDVGLYHDARTGREIRGLPAKQALLETARKLIELVDGVEGWEG